MGEGMKLKGLPARVKRPAPATICFWLACFCVPIAMLCALAYATDVYPFGSVSFLTEDLKYQYIDFFTWYRRVLLGQESIFYSTAQGLGCNTWGLYSYYLASPFNFLILLFDTEHLTLAIFCIVALKLACMQVSASWYLIKRFDLKRFWAFAISLGYTWSLWSATNLRNPLWLDALILLPILLYGVWILVTRGRWKLLCVATAVNVICCWYTAYMCIIFLVFATILEWWSSGRRCGGLLLARTAAPPELHRASIVRLAGRFALPMAVAVLLSAWTLVPTVLAMSSSGGGANTGLMDTVRVIFEQDSLRAAFDASKCSSIRETLRGFVPVLWDEFNNIPQIWCGLFLYVCAGAFLVNRRLSARVKIGWLVLFLIVLSGVVFAPIQALWCGFRAPNGFYSRVAMFVAPTLLWAAGCALRELQGLDWPMRLRKLKAPLAGVLLVFIVVDLFLGNCSAWKKIYVEYTQAEQDFYAAESAGQIAELKEADPSFWRFERTYTRVKATALSEGLASQYNGISSYSSVHNSSAIDFLNALGYSNEGEFSTRYVHPILLSDALLGVKYVSTQDSSAGFQQVDGLSDFGGGVYRNPYALDLGYVVSESAVGAQLEGDNPFERQNSFASALAGHEVQLFKKVDAQELLASDTLKTWSVDISDGCLGYAYIDAPDDGWLTLTIDGVSELSNWRWNHSLVPFGEVGDAASSAHIVSISPESEGRVMGESASCLFYQLDLDALQALKDDLSEHQLELSSMSGDGIAGTVEAAEDGWVLLSIPHEDGWTVRVNGAQAHVEGAYDDALTLIHVEAGTSKIEMSFISPGFWPGCIISVVTVLIWGLTVGVRKAMRNRRVQ